MTVAPAALLRSPSLAYDVTGSGPTLVLLHGLTHRRHAWDPIVDLLAEHRRVVTVDLPGHGESPMSETDGNLLDAAIAELDQFLTDVTPAGELPHVAGNSLGGWAALELAARGRVRSATALSPAGFAVNSLDHRRSLAIFTSLRASARLIGPEAASRAMQTKPSRSLMLGAFYGRPWLADVDAAQIDVRSLLENQVLDRAPAEAPTFSPVVDVTTPITVAWGSRDMILPIYQAKRVLRTFPNAKLIKLRGLGHVPMQDDPKLVAEVLLSGSATVAPRARRRK
ncbi:alpha/beta fold hydrolase [Antrihabitans spumae]|uniref:Alpha/beta fold hydrolase n=1 Tax=Antrihabitans spumae TaxID=3373370 RepID=A0ABW7JM27_9NOCA